MRSLFRIVSFSILISSAWGNPTQEDLEYYRRLTLDLRSSGEFKVSLMNEDKFFSYYFELGEPIYENPVISDSPLLDRPENFFRKFWDRISLKDGSKITLNGEDIPLTCIFINGQDNRYSGSTDPRFPQFIMKVYLVANDYSCTGPLNPGWPNNGGRKENWDTYIYYEVRDPTIMLPVESKIRFRWNEFQSVLEN